MNTMKTKYMKGRGSKNDYPPYLTTLAVDGDELEEVNKFVYSRSRLVFTLEIAPTLDYEKP